MTVGQWLGGWLGDWLGAGESAPEGSISGSATITLSAYAQPTAVAEISGTADLVMTASGRIESAPVSPPVVTEATDCWGGAWGMSWGGSWGLSWGDIEVYDSTTAGGPDAVDGREDLDYQANFERFRKAVYAPLPEAVVPPIKEAPTSVAVLPAATALSPSVLALAPSVLLIPGTELSLGNPALGVALPPNDVLRRQQAQNDLAMLLLLSEM